VTPYDAFWGFVGAVGFVGLAVEVARLRRHAVSTGRLGRPSPATGGHRTVTLTRRGARPYDWEAER
jgi:hypothetical protein